MIQFLKLLPTLLMLYREIYKAIETHKKKDVNKKLLIVASKEALKKLNSAESEEDYYEALERFRGIGDLIGMPNDTKKTN